MKRYVVLFIFAALTFVMLAFLYSHSESELDRNHYSVMSLFLISQQTEVALEKDILKGNLHSEYYKKAFENCLALKSAPYGLYRSLSAELDRSIDRYCQAVEAQTEPDTMGLLEKIGQNYFVFYKQAEDEARMFRRLMFGACTVFLCFIIYYTLLLWRSAREMKLLNASLERKVVERTEELMVSQTALLEQQQAAVHSAKLSSLGEMAGGIAHEINTPLAVIGLRLEQLEEAMVENEFDVWSSLQTLKVIKTNAERIAKIISGLRSLARDGKNQSMALHSLSGIIEETLGFCRERFKAHGISLEVVNKTAADLQVQCRSTEISQVLLNLLSNAFDAAEKQNEKWVQVKISETSKMVEICIVDSGHGIPFHLHEKIMQPFFTTKEIGKGTGLGLSVSDNMIKSHNGKLFLNPGLANTCFTISLPKRQPVNLKETA